MTFHFKCEKCGKEAEVTLKLMTSGHAVEPPKELKSMRIQLRCPACGEKGTIVVQAPADVSERIDRLTHLRFKNALNPSMN
jgi:uncharacterized Zn finger protein